MSVNQYLLLLNSFLVYYFHILLTYDITFLLMIWLFFDAYGLHKCYIGLIINLILMAILNHKCIFKAINLKYFKFVFTNSPIHQLVYLTNNMNI